MAIMIVTKQTLKAVPELLKAYDGIGPVLLISAEERLISQAQADEARRKLSIGTEVLVVERPEVLRREGKESPPRLDLPALDGVITKALKDERVKALVHRPQVNLTIPLGVRLEGGSSLPENSPLRRAIVIIIEALRAVAVQRLDFDRKHDASPPDVD